MKGTRAVTWIRAHPGWTFLALLAVLVLVWLWALGLLVTIDYES
jgi:hypothetical protein